MPSWVRACLQGCPSGLGECGSFHWQPGDKTRQLGVEIYIQGLGKRLVFLMGPRVKLAADYSRGWDPEHLRSSLFLEGLESQCSQTLTVRNIYVVE